MILYLFNLKRVNRYIYYSIVITYGRCLRFNKVNYRNIVNHPINR